MKKENISGWGRYPVVSAHGRGFDDERALASHVLQYHGLITHALGRSYGDSALSERVVFTRRYARIRAFDPDTGVLTCESGVSLHAIIDVFLPRGWFPFVTPGTKFVTVGGAIASDVHGKNHQREGSFSRYVVSFDLMLADGTVVRCSQDENAGLFRATCGGMGLTGVILEVTLRLRPVKSGLIEQKVVKTGSLDQTLEMFEEHALATYSAAWIDCLADGGNLGRSILIVGEHAEEGGLGLSKAKRLSIPFDPPGFLLNKRSISIFNALYYAKARQSAAGTLVPLDDFFYPLDAIANWNRLYGKAGFTQYHFVLPRTAGPRGLREVLDTIGEASAKPFLAVLKLLGPQNENLLSFPMEGHSLSLDFKIEPGLFPLLERLDKIVADYGGRLYLAKDARMSAAVFRRGYPRWQEFESIRETGGLRERFNSLQSRRLAI